MSPCMVDDSVHDCGSRQDKSHDIPRISLSFSSLKASAPMTLNSDWRLLFKADNCNTLDVASTVNECFQCHVFAIVNWNSLTARGITLVKKWGYLFRRIMRRSWVPRRKGRKMRKKYIPSLSDSGAGRASWALPAGSGAERWKSFCCKLIPADRLCWQQFTANSSPFRPEKWGFCTP